MSIYKVNENLGTSIKISTLNDMILELEGNLARGIFCKNEIEQLYTDLDFSRKYRREIPLGNSLTTYTDWSHIHSETGYSIWKITPSYYTYDSKNNLYFDNKIFSNKGLADSETAIAFDKVFFYDGATYTDHTTEASTEVGTEFSLMDGVSDYLYLGYSSIFKGIKFEFQTRGKNYTLKVEYYDDTSGINNWVQLTANANNLSDNTSNLSSDGRITWDAPSGWGLTTVNSSSKYWIRISTTTIPVTTAKAYYIIPGNSVISLLALSSEEILNEEWSWCSYGNSIYVTIRNVGSTAYEGNYFITSGSSATNKQNYFIYNHAFTADYVSSAYSATVLSAIIDDSLIPFSASGIVATNVHDAIIAAYQAGEATTIYGAPLTISGQQIRFNYDTATLDLTGNNLKVKDSITLASLTLSNLTSGYVPYADGTKQLINSGLYYNGTNYSFDGTNPLDKVQVYSAADDVRIRIQTDKVNGIAALRYTNDTRTYSTRISPLDMFQIRDVTANLARLNIDTTGYVGIGMDNSIPGALLDLGLAGTTLGVIRFAGSTSGNVSIQPQVTAGTDVILTLPNASGTLARAATSPIALNATTGIITHVSTAGNKHILTGGSVGQLMRNTASGTQGWATVTETSGALAAITTINMSGQLTSTLAIGTAPFVVTSTTPVDNLSIGGNAATASFLFGLVDPNANTLLGWDDTDGAHKFITLGTGLSYDHATHTLSATGTAVSSLDDLTNVFVSSGLADKQLLAYDNSLSLWRNFFLSELHIAKTFSMSFANADLLSGKLNIHHGLGSTNIDVIIRDNNNKRILPDDDDTSQSNEAIEDLSSYGTITGTWSVTVVAKL